MQKYLFSKNVSKEKVQHDMVHRSIPGVVDLYRNMFLLSYFASVGMHGACVSTPSGDTGSSDNYVYVCPKCSEHTQFSSTDVPDDMLDVCLTSECIFNALLKFCGLTLFGLIALKDESHDSDYESTVTQQLSQDNNYDGSSSGEDSVESDSNPLQVTALGDVGGVVLAEELSPVPEEINSDDKIQDS